jgi:hypothetical protein
MVRARHRERTQLQPCSLHTKRGTELAILILACLLTAQPAAAQKLRLSQAPGRPALSPAPANNYFLSFGTMNALGIGTPLAGVSVAALSNGALYFFTYQLTISGLAAGHKAGVTVYVSTNFSHPAALVMENCPITTACNTSGEYSLMSTSAGAPSIVVAPPGVGNSTVTAGIGVFLPDNDGASAYTGTDTSTVTITATDLNTNTVIGTAVIFFNSPAETVQDAVQLTLSTATGGVTLSPAADFAMNFGNVNGLGIGAAAGLTTVAAAGGVIYHTPYLLNPAFADFTSTTGTLSVYASKVFAHPAVLHLDDSASTAGPYATISVTAGAPTQITTVAHDRTSVTRYLGLFVSNVNGAAAFTGTDNATLTFTMTVP